MGGDPTDAPDTVRVPVAVLLALRELVAEVTRLREELVGLRTHLEEHIAEERPAMTLARRYAELALEAATETAGVAAAGVLTAHESRRAEERREAELRAALTSRLRQAAYAGAILIALAVTYLAGQYAPAIIRGSTPTSEAHDAP